MKMGIKKCMVLVAGLMAAQAAFGVNEKARAKKVSSTPFYNKSGSFIKVQGALGVSWTISPNKYVTFQTGLQDTLEILVLETDSRTGKLVLQNGKPTTIATPAFDMAPIKTKFAEIKKVEFHGDYTLRLLGRLRYEPKSYVPLRNEIDEEVYIVGLESYCGLTAAASAVRRAEKRYRAAVSAFIDHASQLPFAEIANYVNQLPVSAPEKAEYVQLLKAEAEEKIAQEKKAPQAQQQQKETLQEKVRRIKQESEQLRAKVEEAKNDVAVAEANALQVLPTGVAADHIKCTLRMKRGYLQGTEYYVENIKPILGTQESSKGALDTTTRITHPTKFTNKTNGIIQVKGALGVFTTIQPGPNKSESFQTGLQDNLQIKIKADSEPGKVNWKILEFNLKQIKEQFTWIKSAELVESQSYVQRTVPEAVSSYTLTLHGIPKRDVPSDKGLSRKTMLKDSCVGCDVRTVQDGTVFVLGIKPK
jgi:esterase/lipase